MRAAATGPCRAREVGLGTPLCARVTIGELPQNEPLIRRWRKSLEELGLTYREYSSGDQGPDRVFEFESTVGGALRLGFDARVPGELAAALREQYPQLDEEPLQLRLSQLKAAAGLSPGEQWDDP